MKSKRTCQLCMVRASFSKSNLSVLMIDHNVMRLHIAVHNALAVTEVESLEELEDVVADVEVVEPGVEGAELGVVDVFEDERRSLTLAVSHDVEQSDNVGAARQVLENLDLSLDLLLLDGLEHLDDAFLVINHVDALEDLRVLSPAYQSVRFGRRLVYFFFISEGGYVGRIGTHQSF